MKKISLLGITVLSIFVLGACSSGGDENVTVSTKDSSSSESVSEVSSESVSETTAESAPVSEVGKRSNPVPLGQTATFDTDFYDDSSTKYEGNLSITLSNVVRGDEAMTYLMAANQFNEPAPEGNEWIIFQVDETLNKGDADVAFYEMGSFKVVDSSGAELSQSAYATLADGEDFGWVDLYEGASTSGKKAIYAPVGESLLVEYTGNDFETSVFFALQ